MSKYSFFINDKEIVSSQKSVTFLIYYIHSLHQNTMYYFEINDLLNNSQFGLGLGSH